MMDYAEIKTRVNMDDLLSAYSIDTVKGRCACPLHGGDNKTGFSVHSDSDGWTCHTTCDCSGDIFTFVEKYENVDNSQARIRIMEMFGLESPAPVAPKKKKSKPKAAVSKTTEYVYRTKDAKPLYKVIRADYVDGKKDCFLEYNGKFSLPVEVRTLYNLDMIEDAGLDFVCLCEGEKTADALMSVDYVGTTNPLGSKNWNASYAELLKDKNVVVMPDSDKHGEKWRDEVKESLCGVVESLRVVNVPDGFIKEYPEFTGHDFADYIEKVGIEQSKEDITGLISVAEVLPRGVDPDLLGRPSDTWSNIVKRAKLGISTNIFNLREWLPSMNVNVKEGDLLVLMANTSTGKTRILHNFPYYIRRLNYVIFDLELSKDTLALRYAAMENGLSVTSVEHRLEHGLEVKDVSVDNVFIQKIDSLTLDKIKERVELIERVTGRRIHGVGVDYVGLMSGAGSKYEATSDNVERFKEYIGTSNKFGILTTQVARPENKIEGMFQCPSPFSAKNSGSIENSAQTLIGFWKVKNEQNVLKARVMKHTHGEYPSEDITLSANDLRITELTPAPAPAARYE